MCPRKIPTRNALIPPNLEHAEVPRNLRHQVAYRPVMIKPNYSPRALAVIRSITGWLSEHIAIVLTVTGVVLYGGSRIAVDAFYQPLGTTAEEVGLSYITIVAHAGTVLAMGLAPLLLLTAFLAACIYWLTLRCIGVMKRFRKTAFTFLDEGKVPDLFWASVLMGGACVGGAAYLSAAPTTSRPPQPLSRILILVVFPIVFSVLIAFFATNTTLGREDPTTDPRRPSRARQGTDWSVSFYVRSLAFFAALLIGMIIYAADQRGARYARQVQEGHEVHTSAHAAVPLRATCVALFPTSQPSPASAQLQKNKLLYLGQSNGIMVLYQVDSGPVRVPTGSFALKPASAPCR